MSSCSRLDNAIISEPSLQIGQPVSNSAPLTGAIKGTMLAGKTYFISGQVTINSGDTLLVQNGVTVYMQNNADIVVRGTFLSLGTQDAPNTFTVQGVSREDNPGQDPSNDPAFQGLWAGINVDTSCTLLVIKWTHINYVGSAFNIPPVSGYSQGDPSDAMYFQNVNGVCVVEDSWFYGSVDEAIKVVSGKLSIMRNTFEKCGYQGGNTVNVKSGAVGDVAYNLFMGVGADGVTASNKGGAPVQCQISTYNNTFIDCGW